MTYFEDAASVVERPRLSISGDSPGLWERGEPQFDIEGQLVRGGMFDHQRAWWDLDAFIRLLIGGFGAGKTLIGAKWSIAMALDNAPCPWAYVAPTFSIARETGISTLVEQLEGKRSILGPGFHWTYNRSTHEFIIRYHGRQARILVYSGDNPLSLRGPNLAGAWIDEPFIQSIEVYKQMVARVRHPGARKRAIGMTGTPEELNWGYDLAEGELSKKQSVGFIQASTKANRALPEEYIDNLEATFSGKEREAYIEGGFVNLSKGVVYHAFNASESVVDLDIPPEAELGLGMDFNVNPMAFVVFWRIGERIHYFDEFELPNSDTEYACSLLREQTYSKELKEAYPDPAGRQRHTNAPGGVSDFTFLRRAGFHLNYKKQYPRRDRYNAANAKLKARKGRVYCTISPKCERLIRALRLYTHENMNKTEGKAASHILDAFSYPLAFLYPVDKRTLTQARLTGV